MYFIIKQSDYSLYIDLILTESLTFFSQIPAAEPTTPSVLQTKCISTPNQTSKPTPNPSINTNAPTTVTTSKPAPSVSNSTTTTKASTPGQTTSVTSATSQLPVGVTVVPNVGVMPGVALGGGTPGAPGVVTVNAGGK